MRFATRKNRMVPREFDPDRPPIIGRNPRTTRFGMPTGTIMEWVSWYAGVPWGEKPPCTHPALALAMTMTCRYVGHTERQRLAALIPLLVNAKRPWRAEGAEVDKQLALWLLYQSMMRNPLTYSPQMRQVALHLARREVDAASTILTDQFPEYQDARGWHALRLLHQVTAALLAHNPVGNIALCTEHAYYSVPRSQWFEMSTWMLDSYGNILKSVTERERRP